MFHTRTVPSLDPDTIRCPSAENVRHTTLSLLNGPPAGVPAALPVACQTWMWLGVHVATSLPLGENATAWTQNRPCFPAGLYSASSSSSPSVTSEETKLLWTRE